MENANDTQSMNTATQPEENGGRTFTQEEVNKIISERLARERSRAASETSKEVEQRMSELDARENRLACKEYVSDNGLPAELLEVIDTSNTEEFIAKAEKLYDAIERERNNRLPPAPMYSSELPPSSSLDDAFGRGVKHTPKTSR